jgi:hypothetical protein
MYFVRPYTHEMTGSVFLSLAAIGIGVGVIVSAFWTSLMIILHFGTHNINGQVVRLGTEKVI